MKRDFRGPVKFFCSGSAHPHGFTGVEDFRDAVVSHEAVAVHQLAIAEHLAGVRILCGDVPVFDPIDFLGPLGPLWFQVVPEDFTGTAFDPDRYLLRRFEDDGRTETRVDRHAFTPSTFRPKSTIDCR